MNPFRYGCIVAGDISGDVQELAETEHARVFSGEFLSANCIKNVGSVTKAIRRLVEDELIFEYEGEYRFENPFFRRWLVGRGG